MIKILIISATSKTNLKLSEDIKEILSTQNDVKSSILNLDTLDLPLYSESNYNSKKSKVKDVIDNIIDKFINADGIIVCGPEYNGSIPPIISNTIAWISVSTEHWRDGFKDKNAFIATSSGGPGKKFIKSMDIQLDHLGMKVFKEFISVSTSYPINFEKSTKVLKQFIKNI